MSNQKIDFTDLVLLIGTNPLPNYVVAKHFCLTNKSLQRIWLIYSEKTKFHDGTGQYAEDIEKVIKEELGEEKVSYIKRSLPDISQAPEIIKRVKNIFSNEQAQIKAVHLNYTGGTKAMSVHIYRAIEGIFGDRFSASYLDARDYHIKFDNNPDIITGDLRKIIQLEMSGLFSLHDSEIKHLEKVYIESIDEKYKSEIMKSLADLANKNKLLDLRNWFTAANQGGLFKEGKKDKNLIDKTMAKFNLHSYPELLEYLSQFPANDSFCDKEGNWLYNNFDKNVNSNLLKTFNDGGWLEAYVAWVLKQKTGGENDVITNVNLKTKKRDRDIHNYEKKDKGSERFEIDVLVKNGYQICGISCGTSMKYKNGQEILSNTLKSKGFEVILRSAQIGGEEARSVLVTLLNPQRAKNLENDLKASTGAGQDKFIVLGRNDLPVEKMWEKLKKHIYK